MQSAQFKILLVAFVGAFMALLDATIVNIAFPDIRASFSEAKLADLSWILNGYNVVFASLMIPMGRLADRVGRKRVYLAGIATFVAASAACAVANSVELLVAARVVQAIGAAALVPTSVSLLLAAFSVERRSLVINGWGAVAAVATASGPAIGGLLIDASSWRLVFLVNIPIGLTALAIGLRSLEESNDPNAKRSDVVSASLLTTALFLLALAIVKGGDWGWLSAPTLATFIGSAALGVLFYFRNGRVDSQIFEYEIFQNRAFAVGTVGTLIFAIGFYALLLCNVLFLTSIWHYSVIEAGLALTPAPLVAAIFALLGGRLAQRYGYTRVIVPGTVVFAGGAFWLVAVLGDSPEYVSQWLPAAVMSGIGTGLAFPTLGTAAVQLLRDDVFATGSAINSTARQIGAVLGVSLLIVIVSEATSLTAHGWFIKGWTMCAVASLVAGAVASGLGWTRMQKIEQIRPS